MPKEFNVEYNRFERGIDLRKSSSVSDANRMQMIRNAYVTDGWAIRKREGAARISSYTNTFAMGAGIDPIVTKGVPNDPLSMLRTYLPLIVSNSSAAPVRTPIDDVLNGAVSFDARIYPIFYPTTTGADPQPPIVEVHEFEAFQGGNYVVVQFDVSAFPAFTQEVVHYYKEVPIDISTFNSDTSFPTSVVKLSGRMYSTDGRIIRFSGVGLPSNYTAPGDAGFIDVSLQADRQEITTAVAEFDGKLAVFFENSIQLWITDEIPAQHQLIKIIRNGGTLFPKSIQSFSNDLIYLSRSGFRSISRQQFTDNQQDNDVGSPIDDLVVQDIEAAITNNSRVFSVYYQKLGQYWCFINGKAYVYTRSASSQVAAWSIYEFNEPITYAVSIGKFLYLYDANGGFHVMDERMKLDGLISFSAEVLFSFQSQKTPAIKKRYNSMDLVQEGSCKVSHLYNPRDLTKESTATTVSGNTRPFNRYPMGLLTTEIATRLVHDTDEDWQFDSLMYFYNKLGVRA